MRQVDACHPDLGKSERRAPLAQLRQCGCPVAIDVPFTSSASPGAPLAICHFDFYRFDDPQEWEDAGFRDVFASPGLKLAEWPEKAEDLLPEADLQVQIEPGDGDERRVTYSAHTARGIELLP